MKPSRQLMELRAQYARTWQNVVDNGGSGLLRNAPAGFPYEGPTPSRVWKGSDRLSAYGFGPWDDGGYWTGSQGGWVTRDRTGWMGDPASLPAVGRATSLICDTLAGLPWRLLRGRETLDPPPWIADPANKRGDPRFGDGDPDPSRDGFATVPWRAQLLVGMLWWGDGFIYAPNRGQDRKPLPPVYVVPPYEVESVTPWSDDPRTPGHYVAGTDLRFDPDSIIHLRGEPPYDANGRSMGVLARYAAAYGLLGDLGEYGSSTFRGGVPAGYLKVNTPNLADDQAENLRAKWESKHSGVGRGIAVLNSVTDFVPIAFSPVDAALIESKRLSMLDVALAFGVDPYKLGLPTDDATYANIESRNVAFVQDTLLPWARRVESGLDYEFAYGTSLHIDLRGLMRADTATRVSAYHQAITDGWMTVEEVRDLEDLPPLTAAQKKELAPAPVPLQLVQPNAQPPVPPVPTAQQEVPA